MYLTLYYLEPHVFFHFGVPVRGVLKRGGTADPHHVFISYSILPIDILFIFEYYSDCNTILELLDIIKYRDKNNLA